jgi:hypothetical protein
VVISYTGKCGTVDYVPPLNYAVRVKTVYRGLDNILALEASYIRPLDPLSHIGSHSCSTHSYLDQTLKDGSMGRLGTILSYGSKH